jgi:ribose transport system ATP-binding protein
VSLTVEPGEVHALVGENGAGKSTLVKILSGAITPDIGNLLLDGTTFQPTDPLVARQAGVAMVYQELALAPHLSVEDNIMLGRELHRYGWLRRNQQREKVTEALKVLDHPELNPSTLVGSLTPGTRQLVELARALAGDARVVILDEPTSSLTHDDTQRLFTIIERLKSRGVSIIYISHFLDEVQRIADRYTVLRNGESVASGEVKGTPLQVIIEQMIGRPMGELYPRVPHELGKEVFQVKHLVGQPLPKEVSFRLRRGEIMGVFGLVGAGRTETLRGIFGLEPASLHTLQWKSRSLAKDDTHNRLRAGLGMLSEDRKHEGLSVHQSLEENMTLSRLEPYVKRGWLSWSKRREATHDWLTKFNVKHRSVEQHASELSGGNQQKLALARLFHQGAELLLLDEPTKGVDIGSKQEIYRLIGEQAAMGKTFIVVSSYLPELFGICDTLAVMVRGKLSSKREIKNFTYEEAMSLATATT